MMMKLLLLAATAVLVSLDAASSYVVVPSVARSSSIRPATKLYENFGLGLGEDTYANQPKLLGGEAEYKQWMGKIDENAFVNRQVRSFN
jgi:hypothetical protein